MNAAVALLLAAAVVGGAVLIARRRQQDALADAAARGMNPFDQPLPTTKEEAAAYVLGHVKWHTGVIAGAIGGDGEPLSCYLARKLGNPPPKGCTS